MKDAGSLEGGWMKDAGWLEGGWMKEGLNMFIHYSFSSPFFLLIGLFFRRISLLVIVVTLIKAHSGVWSSSRGQQVSSS